MANTYLNRTFSGTPTMTTFTVSFWIKRATIGATQRIISARVDGNNESTFYFSSSDQLNIATTVGGATKCDIKANRRFRDTSGWYHVVVQKNTTLATANDRVKIWVNGVEETDVTRSTTQVQNEEDFFLKSTATNEIGRRPSNNDQYFGGYLTHFCIVQGSVVAPTSFGQTDSTSGMWKFKSPSGVTWGTNGFHLKFENSANLGLDSSSNTNNWTVGGNLKQALDTPSNVYATMNPLLVPTSNPPTFSNANTTSESSSNGSSKWGGCTTLGMTTGKWYCEAKATVNASYSRNVIGITGDSANIARTNGSILNGTHSWGWYSENGSISGNGSANIQTGTTYGTGDIVMVALDLDNNKLYFGKNGSWVYSGVPTSGSTGTGAISIIAASTTNDQAYFFGQNDDTGTSATSKFDWNFGNGFFGTTAITSAGSNGNGSLFEYDCPTGYYALNTKNINTYG